MHLDPLGQWLRHQDTRLFSKSYMLCRLSIRKLSAILWSEELFICFKIVEIGTCDMILQNILFLMKWVCVRSCWQSPDSSFIKHIYIFFILFTIPDARNSVFGYYIIAPPIFYYSSVNNLLHVNHNIIVLSTIYYSNVNSLLELRQQSIMSPPTIKFCVMLSTFVILYFNTSNMCIISAPRQIRRHFAYIDIYIYIYCIH
jgi:hypothetical protein